MHPRFTAGAFWPFSCKQRSGSNHIKVKAPYHQGLITEQVGRESNRQPAVVEFCPAHV
jgi:hypothetical protein